MGKLEKFLLFIFIAIIMVSCTEKTAIKVIECKKLNSIDVLPDSTFMSEILKMQYIDSFIFFIEKTSRQLVVLQSDFTKNKRIGNWGVGPQEVLEPRNFIIFNDTAYIMDIGSNAIKCYTLDNRFVKSVHTNVMSEQRIFNRNSTLYLAAYNRQNKMPLARIKLCDDSLSTYFWGKAFEFNQPLQNMIRNKRDLLCNDSNYYCVSDNLPFIEKYDFSNDSLLQLFDYSFIPVIKENLDIIRNKPTRENTYTAFVRDSYIYKDDLYLLISKQGSEFRANVIVKIKLHPEFKVINIYLLPGRVYSTFCIGNDFIFAFNSESTAIEQIGLY